MSNPPFVSTLQIQPLGDTAVVATLGADIDDTLVERVRALAAAIEQAKAPGVVDVVPAYASVTVVYDPIRFAGAGARPYQTVSQLIAWCQARAEGKGSASPVDSGSRLVEIPVCYGGDFGPDLEALAGHAGLAPEQAQALHAEPVYRVCAIGFLPGFPYLAGLAPALRTPRRDTPRVRVPAGSVAIGGSQTGIYPLESPGGWNIIGRTPLALFEARRSPASILRAGDRVRFRPISHGDYASWR